LHHHLHRRWNGSGHATSSLPERGNVTAFFNECLKTGKGCVITSGSIISFAKDKVTSTRLKNDLVIEKNPKLETCVGLESLTKIDGDINVVRNAVLRSLEGLQKVESLGDDINIVGNPKLVQIQHLSGLKGGLPGDINLHNNPTLESLAGLGGITHVAGDFKVTDLEAIRDLSGIDALSLVGGVRFSPSPPAFACFIPYEFGFARDLTRRLQAVRITGNDKLQTLTGAKIESIGSGFVISENPVLQEIRLDALKTVGGALLILHNAALKTINFRALREVYSLALVNNNALVDTSGFQLLETVTGTMLIKGNAALPDLKMNGTVSETSDFKRLKHVGKDLRIVDNAELSELGFMSLITVDGSLEVVSNPTLACSVTRNVSSKEKNSSSREGNRNQNH
jgi:hypothetical protein